MYWIADCQDSNGNAASVRPLAYDEIIVPTTFSTSIHRSMSLMTKI